MFKLIKEGKKKDKPTDENINSNGIENDNREKSIFDFIYHLIAVGVRTFIILFQLFYTNFGSSKKSRLILIQSTRWILINGVDSTFNIVAYKQKPNQKYTKYNEKKKK